MPAQNIARLYEAFVGHTQEYADFESAPVWHKSLAKIYGNK